ncbi:MAG: esterase [Alphaproteobacteria bacterium RIFCSPHIGHO2_12_FULL_63_12]|nr:MAG: esterase [Alphaproteobacteria bacterium RIFCSPHIGHO2_12_FULL_63_12]
MLYSAFEFGYAAMTPARLAAGFGAKFWRSSANPMADTWVARASAAALDVFEHATRRYPKPEWEITETMIGGRQVPVTIETAIDKPFCRLLHFRRDEKARRAARGGSAQDPAVLIVAPLSGHHATLLRGTVEAMLPGHDVYITDWKNARNVPLSEGRFDLNDYVDYLIGFLQEIGPRAHAVAVCQPGPALLAAAALMAEESDPCRPASITIMGSPIDARRSPTVPNLLAQERKFEWFERNMIYTTPAPYTGVMRRVYPGFVQLYSFLSMNHDRHLNAHYDYFNHLVEGDGDNADKHRKFYDEYLSVLDLTEEFYLQTIREVFQEFSLAEGNFLHRGRRVRPEAITDIALMTVEGENDDISGIGQTQAAHDLCVNIPSEMKFDYIQPGVGHYGVFNGSRWRNEIQPRLAKFIREHDRAEPAFAEAAE